MKFSFDMTIEQLVEEMNGGGSQKELYALSKIQKDILPFLFKAAGYIREKQKYVAAADANTTITIKKLVPIAKELHKQTKIEKLTNTELVASKVVVLEAEKPTQQVENSELMQTNVGANVFDFSDKEQMQHTILEVLDLTPEHLEAIRSIGLLREVAEATTDTANIFEEIKKLSGRNRANKTYFLSKELTENIKEFANSHNIKVSQIIEIAIIDFLKKY